MPNLSALTKIDALKLGTLNECVNGLELGGITMKKTVIFEDGELYQEFKAYDRAMKRANVDSFTFEKVNNLIKNGGRVVMTIERYNRRGAKYNALVESETKDIDAREYACIMSSIGYFKSRCSMGYTYFGYISTKITDFAPDRSCKLVRTFKFEV